MYKLLTENLTLIKCGKFRIALALWHCGTLAIIHQVIRRLFSVEKSGEKYGAGGPIDRTVPTLQSKI